MSTDSVDRAFRNMAHDTIQWNLSRIPDHVLAEIALYKDGERLQEYGINNMLLENVAGDATDPKLRRRRVEDAMTLPKPQMDRVREIVDLLKQERKLQTIQNGGKGA